MTNEIKEILDKLKDCVNNPIDIEVDQFTLEAYHIPNYFCLDATTNDCKLLLDYITNLQNQLEEKTYLYNKLDTESKCAITNLQDENKRLKNLYTNEKSHKIDYDYFKVLYKGKNKDCVINSLVYKCEQCRVLYDSAEKTSIENRNLQYQIDKTIEYINQLDKLEDKIDDYSISKYVKKELLGILRGDE